jgi:nucleotide-binding universal stress UspA family protein
VTSSAETRSAASPLIVCYDGSEEAREGLNFAAELFRAARALVVTIWTPVLEEALSTAGRPPAGDLSSANESEERAARQLANEGARRASAAGLHAEPLAIKAIGPIWLAIDALAETQDARLVVCGTRRTGLRSALPGNLATALVNNASRPVVVVPSAKARVERQREAHEKQAHRASAVR